MRCGHNDCFTCPYSDCIDDGKTKTELKKSAQESEKEILNKRIWITNGKEIFLIHRYELDKYRKLGYCRGRKLF